jgi:hypothetical protein
MKQRLALTRYVFGLNAFKIRTDDEQWVFRETGMPFLLISKYENEKMC